MLEIYIKNLYIINVSIELMFQKDFMLIKQVHQKSLIIKSLLVFPQIKNLSFNQMFAIDAMIY